MTPRATEPVHHRRVGWVTTVGPESVVFELTYEQPPFHARTFADRAGTTHLRITSPQAEQLATAIDAVLSGLPSRVPQDAAPEWSVTAGDAEIGLAGPLLVDTGRPPTPGGVGRRFVIATGDLWGLRAALHRAGFAAPAVP